MVGLPHSKVSHLSSLADRLQNARKLITNIELVKKRKRMSNPFQKACDILEQQTRVDIAEEELAQAEELVVEKRNNLFNEKAKLEELESE
tara:strand:- start:110 stop:379 length:270 start_codon:yes stop_codon:yes gene_type:complete